MKVQIQGSSIGPASSLQYAQTILVNDAVAIDAGSLGFLAPLETQQNISHVFLSHSHLDHVATLPLFLDNVYKPSDGSPTIHAQRETFAALDDHFFNEVIWPDLARLSREETPFFQENELHDCQPIQLGGLTVTPVKLNHVVPTMGFLIEESGASIAIISDTLPSSRIWEVVNAAPDLKAVYLECSFPQSMSWLAEKAGHLSPSTFQSELRKLSRPDVAVFAIHLKPAFEDQIIQELQAFDLPNLQIGTNLILEL